MLRKILILVVLLSTVVITYAQKKDKKKRKNKKNKTEQVVDSAVDFKAIGAPMPMLRLTTRKGDKLTEKDFSYDGNLIVMMFNPTCDHCQEQTINFEKEAELFDKTKIVMVAGPQMVDYLQFYNNVTRYHKYPHITVGVDSSGFIDKAYNYGSLPQINIYDKDRKLIRQSNGSVEIEVLKPFIE